MYGIMYNFEKKSNFRPRCFPVTGFVLHNNNTKHRREIGRAYRQGMTLDWELQL